ncbi:atrial natriuretic peptide receptor 1-like [Tachypleus tridentatus]|uniref:atrial natriuretic peptide receptor 1-like n=1 Tax=Tachypleus tridentatus TaxID=6853 RepID=UPI003FD58EB6
MEVQRPSTDPHDVDFATLDVFKGLIVRLGDRVFTLLTQQFFTDEHYGKQLVFQHYNYDFHTTHDKIKGTSGDLYININGDREPNMVLKDFKKETGVFHKVAVYNSVTKVWKTIPGVSIHWPYRNSSPLDVPLCGFDGRHPSCQENTSFSNYISSLLAVFTVLLVLAIGTFVVYRKLKFEADLNDYWWKLDIVDIKPEDSQQPSENLIVGDVTQPVKPKKCTSETQETLTGPQIFVATFKSLKVSVKELHVLHIKLTRHLLMEIRQMRDEIHNNVNRFVGLCLHEPYVYIVSEYCQRRSLCELLNNYDINIDWTIRFSIINDIVQGLMFIHGSSINYHGRLKSTNCLLTSRFAVKLSDFGLRSLRNQYFFQPGNIIEPASLLWTAPEHLRERYPGKNGSQKGDVYSFAIVLQEVITRTRPFECGTTNRGDISPTKIIENVKTRMDPPFRPQLSTSDCPSNLCHILYNCWEEKPENRPLFPTLKHKLKLVTGGLSNKNFMDNLLSRMEKYANNLEKLVEYKTAAFVEEKTRSEDLLYQLLPRYIANQLISGSRVIPEIFDSVTIFFSDIVGFTALSAQSTPMEVVGVLNDLYSCFDVILAKHDVYKVETIGDAYMVVSGAPVPNGQQHALEIARMSLNVREALKNFQVRHRPHERLTMRIGVHSGPCAAGVVGLKRPRYCLFGDTVNTAALMESSGEEMKIHISSETKRILDEFGTFYMSLRGETELKGKGLVRTYWLEKHIEYYLDECESMETLNGTKIINPFT